MLQLLQLSANHIQYGISISFKILTIQKCYSSYWKQKDIFRATPSSLWASQARRTQLVSVYLFWCPYPRTLRNPELSSAASMINHQNIWPLCFDFCDVLILLSSGCHHSNGGRPDFYLLVVVICQIYFALKTKLSIHPQTRSTVSHLLQYLLFHQLRTSFY